MHFTHILYVAPIKYIKIMFNLKHFSFNMTHFASSFCRLVRRSPQGVMGLRTRISTRPGGRLRWPTGFDFGGVWQRYTARPMRRIAQRAVPCQTTRQKQTKWVILKEICFSIFTPRSSNMQPTARGLKPYASWQYASSHLAAVLVKRLLVSDLGKEC